MFGVVLYGVRWLKKPVIQRRFPVVNVAYQLLYFVERPRRGLRWTPSRCEDVSLACGAFPLGRGENKITGIILTLMNVQICLHRYTLSRSFHPFPPLCDLLLMTHNTQILVVFRVHFTFVYLRFCPESSPDVHLRRACSVSLPAALLWLPAKRRQQTRPCQEDAQKQAQHAAVD